MLDNVLLDTEGYDPFRDSPGDGLHWDYGVPKYHFIDEKAFLKSDESTEQMKAIFDSLNQNGMPNKFDSTWAVTYRGSMVAKDYKHLSQVRFLCFCIRLILNIEMLVIVLSQAHAFCLLVVLKSYLPRTCWHENAYVSAKARHDKGQEGESARRQGGRICLRRG